MRPGCSIAVGAVVRLAAAARRPEDGERHVNGPARPAEGEQAESCTAVRFACWLAAATVTSAHPTLHALLTPSLPQAGKIIEGAMSHSAWLEGAMSHGEEKMVLTEKNPGLQVS